MWEPPSQLWQGGTCWVIGGGPSILEQFKVPQRLRKALKYREVPLSSLSPFLSPLYERPVIGINNAYALGEWVNFVFFGDSTWFLHHRRHLAKYRIMKVSCAPRNYNWSNDNDEQIKPMQRNSEKKWGITTKPGWVPWNKNSGAASLSLAAQLGVKRIVLIGFDMDIDVEGDTHWHGCHWEKVSGPRDPKGRPVQRPKQDRKKRANNTFNRMKPAFSHVMEDAEELGITIVNANPDSSIEAVPKVPLQDLLEDEQNTLEQHEWNKTLHPLS